MPVGDGPLAVGPLAPLPPPRRRRRVMLDRIRLGLLFGISFLAATLGLGLAGRFALPPAEIVELTAKLHPLIRDDNDVDTIAIGSSRVLADFDPQAFDSAAAAAGCPIHSYNLGVADMNVIEMRYLLDRIGQARLPHLKRILLDPPNDIHVGFDNLHSERMWVTTDPRTASLAVQDIWSHPDPRKLSATLRYAVAFLDRNSAVGLLGRVLQPGPQPEPKWPAIMLANGQTPLGPDVVMESHALLLRNAEAFAAKTAALRREGAGEGPPTPIPVDQERRRIDGVLELAGLIGRMGYQPVLLHLPDTYGEAITDAKGIERALRERQPPIPDIDLMSGQWAAQVYDAAAWYDQTHLTKAAAGRISAIAGASLCRQLGGS